MIYVDRSRIEIPHALQLLPGSKVHEELERAAAFHSRDIQERRQGRSEFRAFQHPEVLDALHRLFHEKCSICESEIGKDGAEHTYRPIRGVDSSDGEFLPDHYWWLGVRWSNLLLICPNCHRSLKGNAFPIFGPRAPLPDGPDYLDEAALRAEEPAYLNPCEDDPHIHLHFDESGRVSGLTPQGQETIEHFRLNRPSLTKPREEAASAFLAWGRNQLKPAQGLDELETLQESLSAVLGPDASFAGMKRQLAERNFGEHFSLDWEKPPEPLAIRADSGSTNISISAAVSGSSKVTADPDVTKARAEQRAIENQREDYSLEDQEGLEKYREQQLLLRRVLITNLGPIEQLDLPLIPDSSSRVPWKMLLGENACGKSTVLKCIALALSGRRRAKEMAERSNWDLSRLVRKGCASGSVEVEIEGFSRSHSLTIYKNGELEWGEQEDVRVQLLGYGATRLMPRPGHEGPEEGDVLRVDNLFNPFFPLVDATTWMANLEEHLFDYTARALKALLCLPSDVGFIRRDGEVFVELPAGEMDFGRLSDGYRSVIGMLCDILQVTFHIWSTPESATGVVLIDEIGTHLHPSWKMRFVEHVREFLPGMQFIATTHDPLCLRGLNDGEVTLMRKDKEDHVSALSQLPSLRGMRVDQILTSEHFGLGSTADPELNDLLNDYYQLLKDAETLSDETQQQAKDLQAQIDQRQSLGSSERERYLLRAIDVFLAKRDTLELDRTDAEAALAAELQGLWEQSGGST